MVQDTEFISQGVADCWSYCSLVVTNLHKSVTSRKQKSCQIHLRN